MNSKLWMNKALSMCLTVAILATCSMFTLANSERIAGELTISGEKANSETSFVKVNGEIAQNGRSIFSSSTIATSDNAGAIVNLGKSGKIELAPNTVLVLSFDEKNISGDLSAGQVTVLNSAEAVNIKKVDGTTARLKTGDSTAATGKASDSDDTTGGGGHTAIIFAAILGGAAIAIIIAATTNNNRINIGGGTTVISPTR